MSKNNKNLNKNFSNDGPDVHNMDDISYMIDESIHDYAGRLEFEREKLISTNRNPYLWEVELAYLHREMELRRTRFVAHAEFVKRLIPIDTEAIKSGLTNESNNVNDDNLN